MPSYKYPLLNNQEWLYDTYVTQGKSTIELATLAGAKTCNSARQALLRHGLHVRSGREAWDLEKRGQDYQFDYSVIVGALLGDAYMQKYNKSSDLSYPYFAKRNKHCDHIQYTASCAVGSSAALSCTGSAIEDGYQIYTLRTLSDGKLLDTFKEWYPKEFDYVKRVPDGLTMDPTALLHWFMDDGNSYRRRLESTTKQVCITLCFESFSYEDNLKLSTILRDTFNLKVRVGKCGFGTGARLYVAQACTDLFYGIIGSCPVPSMCYKWK